MSTPRIVTKTNAKNSDGKDDYVYVDEDGGLTLWYNRGETDDSMTIDGLRFADIDGDGVRFLTQRLRIILTCSAAER